MSDAEPNRSNLSRHRAFRRNCVVWDNHACLPLRTDPEFLPQLQRFRTSGVDVVSINVGFGQMSWREHLTMLEYFRAWLSNHEADYSLIATVDDIDRCKAEGRLGIVFDIEGMYPLATEPHLVQRCYDLGVRWMLIAYNANNAAGGGCLDEDTGLTVAGRAVIDAMWSAGMVLCVSHTGARTAREAIEYSRHPVICSHSNPAGDTAHPRNISDELIRLVAKTGGVIGLSGIGPFLGALGNPVEALLRQIRYVADLVGPEHVGLGLDYVFDRSELDEYLRQNPHLFPTGLGLTGGMTMIEPEAYPAIVDGLLLAGFADDDVRGILGSNWRRVARKVWR